MSHLQIFSKFLQHFKFDSYLNPSTLPRTMQQCFHICLKLSKFYYLFLRLRFHSEVFWEYVKQFSTWRLFDGSDCVEVREEISTLSSAKQIQSINYLKSLHSYSIQTRQENSTRVRLDFVTIQNRILKLNLNLYF